MAGWQSKSLGDIAQFINGLWKGEEPPLVHVGVIRNTNFTKDGALNDTDIAYLDVEAKKFQKRRLQFGDLILEKSGGGPKQPVGRVVLFDKTEGDFSFSNFTAAIRIVDPAALDSKFLHKYLHWVYVSGRTEAMQSHSTGIRNLNGDAYKAIEVAYPSLPEQQRIVAILDEAFEGIATAKANAEKSLQNASELLNTLTSQAFTQLNEAQVSRALGSVCKFENGDRGKNYPGKEHRVARGVPFINAGHLTPQGVDFSEMDYISPERFSLLGNGKIRPQDVLFCLRGSLGKFASVGSLSCGAIASSLVILRPTHELDHGYLLCFLGSTLCRAQIDAYKGGAAQPNLGAKDLKRFELPLPSLEVQRQVANQITECQERVVELMDSINQKLAALGELKESLLRQAFTGQL